MRISDWSSDVCSSDLLPAGHTLICFSHLRWNFDSHRLQQLMSRFARGGRVIYWEEPEEATPDCEPALGVRTCAETGVVVVTPSLPEPMKTRSEEHTSELQSLMRISYAVFCLKKKKDEIKEDA